MDSSIVALSSIQRDLGFSGTGVAWLVNDYRGGDVPSDRAMGRGPAAANRCAHSRTDRMRMFPGGFRLARPGSRR